MTKAFLLKTTTQDVIDDVDVFDNQAITADKLAVGGITLPISGGGHVYRGANDPANVVLTTADTAAYQQGLKPKGVVYAAASLPNLDPGGGVPTFTYSPTGSGTLTVSDEIVGMLDIVPSTDTGVYPSPPTPVRALVLFNFGSTDARASGIWRLNDDTLGVATFYRATNFNETAEVVVGSFVTSETGAVGGWPYPAGHGYFIRTLDPLFELNDATYGAIAFEHWGKDSAFSYTEGDGVNIGVDGGGAQEISLDTQYPLADDGSGAIGLNYSAPLALNGSYELTALAATDSQDGTLSSEDFVKLAAFASAGRVQTAGSGTAGDYHAQLPDLAVNSIAVNQVRIVMRSVTDDFSAPDTTQVGVITLTCTTKRGASGNVSLLDSTISANQYYLKINGGTAVLKDLGISFNADGDEASKLSIALPTSWTIACSHSAIQKVQDVS